MAQSHCLSGWGSQLNNVTMVVISVILCYCARIAECQGRNGYQGSSGGLSAAWIAGVIISIIAVIFGLVCLVLGICYCRYAIMGRPFTICPSRSGAKKYAEPVTHLHDGMGIGLPSPLDVAPNPFRFTATPGSEPPGQGHAGLPIRLQAYDSPSLAEEAQQSYTLNPELHRKLDTNVDVYCFTERQGGRNGDSESSDEGGSPSFGYCHMAHDVTTDDIISDDAISDDIVTADNVITNVRNYRPPYTLRSPSSPTATVTSTRTESRSSAYSEDARQATVDGAQGARQSWSLFASDCFERGDALPTSLKPDGLYSIEDGVSLDE